MKIRLLNETGMCTLHFALFYVHWTIYIQKHKLRHFSYLSSPLYSCTIVHLYNYKVEHLYSCKIEQLYNWKVVQLNSCTIVQLHNFRTVPLFYLKLYNCTGILRNTKEYIDDWFKEYHCELLLVKKILNATYNVF